MVQSSGSLRFMLETTQPVGIVRDKLRQNFDGHGTFETGVSSPINFAHSARPDQRLDSVLPIEHLTVEASSSNPERDSGEDAG